jgi:hypothetical protein
LIVTLPLLESLEKTLRWSSSKVSGLRKKLVTLMRQSE